MLSYAGALRKRGYVSDSCCLSGLRVRFKTKAAVTDKTQTKCSGWEMGAAIAERQRRVCAMLQSYSGPLERKVEGLLNYLYWV